MWRYRWLRWYQVCLLIVLKFVGVSSKHLRVFLESLRQYAVIFGHLRKFSENVRERWSCLRNNFGKSSQIFGKWSEIFRKSSKMPSSVSFHNRKNITCYLKDMNFMFEWQEQYLTRSLDSLLRYCSCHSNIKFTSSSHHVIPSMGDFKI